MPTINMPLNSPLIDPRSGSLSRPWVAWFNAYIDAIDRLEFAEDEYTTLISQLSSSVISELAKIMPSQGANKADLHDTVKTTERITDNAIPRGDGGEKHLQDSGIKIDDSDNLSSVNSILFNLSPTHSHEEGGIHWNADDKTLNIDTEVSGTAIQVGQENVIRVTNKTGGNLTNGDCVVINGAQGSRPTVALADADSEALTHGTIAVLTNNLDDDATGYATTFGLVRGMNTNAWTAGDSLYISQTGTTTNTLTNSAPAAPAHSTYVGQVLFKSTTEGIIFVAPQVGFELYELHDVLITSLADEQAIEYDTSNTYWKNVNIPGKTRNRAYFFSSF